MQERPCGQSRESTIRIVGESELFIKGVMTKLGTIQPPLLWLRRRCGCRGSNNCASSLPPAETVLLLPPPQPTRSRPKTPALLSCSRQSHAWRRRRRCRCRGRRRLRRTRSTGLRGHQILRSRSRIYWWLPLHELATAKDSGEA